MKTMNEIFIFHSNKTMGGTKSFWCFCFAVICFALKFYTSELPSRQRERLSGPSVFDKSSLLALDVILLRVAVLSMKGCERREIHSRITEIMSFALRLKCMKGGICSSYDSDTRVQGHHLHEMQVIA